MMLFNKVALFVLAGVVLMIDEGKGCYSNLLQCQSQYSSLSATAMSPSGLNLTAYCVSVGLVRTCLNQDAACGSSQAPPEALLLKTTVDNAISSCEAYLEASPSCQNKMTNCTNIAVTMAMQIGQNIANSNSSSVPDFSSIFTMICPILQTTKKCYQDVQAVCPSVKEIIPLSEYEQQIGPMCNNGSIGNFGECTNKIMECTKLISTISSVNSTSVPDICGFYEQYITCMNTAVKECPALAASVATQMSQYSNLIKETCGGDGQLGTVQCAQEYQKCAIQMQPASFDGPPDPQQLQKLCSTMQTTLECFRTVSGKCPKMADTIKNMTSASTSNMLQMCGYIGQLPSSCQQKMSSCVTEFTSQCSQPATTADRVKCCRLFDEMDKCLTGASCPESITVLNIPKIVLREGMRRQCDGYNDYCPGLETCLTSVTSFEELCPKVDEVFNCVSTKCSSNPISANIKQMIKDVCTGLQSYPTISTCATSSQCYNIVMEPFPGSSPSIRSMVDIKSPSYWCRFSKAVSACNDKIIPGNSCSLTGNYVSDMATLKTTIDNTCTTTRTPCPGAVACLATFGAEASTMDKACSGMSAFATCITNALDVCGESSKVKASYSISKIAGEVNKFCAVLSKNPQLTNCSTVRPCLSIPVTGVANGLTLFTNQTFWASFLESMIKCTTTVGRSCEISGATSQELTSLISELRGVTGETDGTTPTIAETCLSQKDTCMQTFTSTCQRQDSPTKEKQCCGIGSEMIECLNKANCPDILYTVGKSKGVFQSENQRYCSESAAYCPGIETCLTGLSGVAELCMGNLDTVFTCFASKCSSNWNPDMIKIKTIIMEMCTGLKKHSALLSCPQFSGCALSNVPGMPGYTGTLPSLARVNSPRNWCQLTKGISFCLGQVAKKGACSLDSSFPSDYSALKSKVDSVCSGTPEPCLGVTACMSSFSDSPSTLLDICDRIPTFVTCAETALNTCGASSKIQAKFSLSDVSARYNRFCVVLRKGSLGTCPAVTECLKIPQTQSTAESVQVFTNQTYMAGLLANMINCTSSSMDSCNQPEETKTEMISIYGEVNALDNPKTTDDGNAATSAVSSIMAVVISSFLVLLHQN